jgi:hypothetical protein
MHWAVQYIGLPWVKDGVGPDAYNCWSFVRWVQAEHYGRKLPVIPHPDDDRDLCALFRGHPEHRRWQVVDSPKDGDLVQMRRRVDPWHIGVWVDIDGGKLLHCARGAGVVCQHLAALAVERWHVEGFYRFRGDV